jgi:hypothetical protein
MVRYAAERRSELSCRIATGTDTMTETVRIDRPPAAKGDGLSPRSRKPATVRASALALHLDCSRTYIGKLEVESVIQRQGDGFSLDQSRIACLRYLRRERRQSPRTEADADHLKVTTELLQLRLMEKKRELVRRADVDELVDGIAGATLTALSGLPDRCAPRGDLAIRRSIERVVVEVRSEIANTCQQKADKCGDPPLNEQQFAKTISVEPDGLQNLLKAVAALAPRDRHESQRYGPAHGGIGGSRAGSYRCRRRETATAFTNWGL